MRLPNVLRARHDERRDDADGHAPEIAKAVETPPIPFDQVGRRIAAPQARRNPLHHIVDRSHEPTDADAQNDDGDRRNITKANAKPLARLGIEEATIDVVDDVGRRGVHRRGKVRHEGREQARHQYAEKSWRYKLGERIGQHLLEVHIDAHVADLGTVKDERQDGETSHHEVTRNVEYDIDDRAHLAGFARVAGERMRCMS